MSVNWYYSAIFKQSDVDWILTDYPNIEEYYNQYIDNPFNKANWERRIDSVTRVNYEKMEIYHEQWKFNAKFECEPMMCKLKRVAKDENGNVKDEKVGEKREKWEGHEREEKNDIAESDEYVNWYYLSSASNNWVPMRRADYAEEGYTQYLKGEIVTKHVFDNISINYEKMETFCDKEKCDKFHTAWKSNHSIRKVRRVVNKF